MDEAKKNLECGHNKEQCSPARIVSGKESLKSHDNQGCVYGERGGACFSPRLCQRACQVPLTRQGGDALRMTYVHTQEVHHTTHCVITSGGSK